MALFKKLLIKSILEHNEVKYPGGKRTSEVTILFEPKLGSDAFIKAKTGNKGIILNCKEKWRGLTNFRCGIQFFSFITSFDTRLHDIVVILYVFYNFKVFIHIFVHIKKIKHFLKKIFFFFCKSVRNWILICSLFITFFIKY